MAGESHVTTDHEAIRNWAESRGGQPAAVRATSSEDDPGIIRIDFPGYSGQRSLAPISWDEFFDKFEEKHLAFVYQDHTADGQVSRFFKLVDRNAAH